MTGSLLAAVLAAQDGGPAPSPSPSPSGMSSSRPSLLDDSGARILDNSPKIIQPRWNRDTPPPRTDLQPGMVIDARVRLYHIASADWYMIRYEREGNSARQPQLLLPCQLLEQVEKCAQGSPPPVLKVSGEITWYRKRSFLLIRDVIGEWGDASDRPRPLPTPTATAEPLTDLASSKPAEGNSPQASAASSPAATGSSSAPAAGSDPDEILRGLASERPGRPIVKHYLDPETQPSAPSVAPAATQPIVSSAIGSLLVDRVVQIYPEEKTGWWAAHFLGDNTLREPPARLLPCPLLEEAEGAITSSAKHLKFRISGEVTSFHGRKYILMRKLVLERDMGQF